MAAARENSAVFNNVALAVQDFLTFHELGHSYVDAFDHSFLAVRFVSTDFFKRDDVNGIRVHKDGPVYGQKPVEGHPMYRL